MRAPRDACPTSPNRQCRRRSRGHPSWWSGVLDKARRFSFGERVLGLPDDHDERVDVLRPSQRGVRRLVAVRLLVDADENVDAPVLVLEPFRRPGVDDIGNTRRHSGEGRPLLQVLARSDACAAPLRISAPTRRAPTCPDPATKRSAWPALSGHDTLSNARTLLGVTTR